MSTDELIVRGIEMEVGLAVAVGDPEPLPIEDAAVMVREVRRLRARVVELEAGEVRTEWGVVALDNTTTWRSERDARAHVADLAVEDNPRLYQRVIRVGPWVPADETGAS